MTARVPHETEAVGTLITAWPVHRDWGDNRAPAARELAEILADVVQHASSARLIVATEAADAEAERALAEATAARGERGERPGALGGGAAGAVSRVRFAYGDIWLRDTGPVFMTGPEGLEAAVFRFNGWGEKYLYPGDADLAERLANAFDARVRRSDLICEGGALEFDGQGTALTTRQCLLNKNRNPNLSERDVEAALKKALNLERILWVDEGLLGDHTDGHIDNLARFVAPGLVVCQAPSSPQDPNAAIYDAVARALDGAEDAAGRRIEVERIPAPTPTLNEDGGPLAASHMNFIHVNGAVIMPAFDRDAEADDFSFRASDRAAEALASLFEGRTVQVASARSIITGGGTFHCCTNAAPQRRSGE